MSKLERLGVHKAAPRTGAARVLIIDDSLVIRSVIERILSDDADFDVVSTLPSTEEAIAFLDNATVDIIVLDIEMPGRSGLDALPDILSRCGDARILVLSSLAKDGGPAALKALALGACDTLAKPGGSFYGQFSQILRDRLQLLARSRLGDAAAGAEAVSPRAAASPSHTACIAIGSSTGGIPPLHDFLLNLSDTCTAPIFIAQHLPGSFMPFLARQLGESTGRAVSVAEQGVLVQPEHVYVAPGGHNMTCVRRDGAVYIELVEPSAAGIYAPAVDPLFESVAACYGNLCTAVVFSGMGRDGLLGAEKVRAAGGVIYVQDIETSVVWGMPGVIARAGLADAVMPPARMARHLSRYWKARK